jgi:hypothetical protein
VKAPTLAGIASKLADALELSAQRARQLKRIRASFDAYLAQRAEEETR